MNTLKHTMKELNTIIKQFTIYKNNYFKSNKTLTTKQSLLAIILAKVDALGTGVQKATKLAQTQESTIMMISKATKSTTPSITTKKTQLIVEQDVAARKVNTIIDEVIRVMKIALEFKEIQQTLESQSQSLPILTFYLQSLLFIIRIKFHLLTFLANTQKMLQPQQQLTISNLAVEAINRCLQSKNTFLLVCTAIIESEDQQSQQIKSINQLENIKDDFKSLLLRISAVFYQLLYNIDESQPEKLGHFFSFTCSLITDKIENQKSNLSQYNNVLQRKNEQKKGFFSFFKKQVNNSKDLTNKSQTIQSLKKKQKHMDSLQMSVNQGPSSGQQRARQQGKGNLKKQTKGGKSMKSQFQQDMRVRKQFFLSKDEVEIVEFYLCSLLEKMFTQEGNNILPLIDDYKQLTDALFNAYVNSFAQSVQDESDKSLHDRLQETLLKIIYKDSKLKHEDLLGQESAYSLTISYQQLLNRVITVLGCLHIFLSGKFGKQRQLKCPQQIIQNSNLLLDFVVTLYEKIMMAHKCFIEAQIAQVADYNGKHTLPSPSQNINSHRNLNKETEKKFNLLYVMNTIAINVIGMLYRSPQALLSEEQKVCELNTVLTLHQIFLNQFNFPNYETENQMLESFRERPKREGKDEKEKDKGEYKLEVSIDMYGEYINSLDILKRQLIKTHEATYNQLKRLHTLNISSNRAPQKQPTQQISKSNTNSPQIRIIYSPQQQLKTPFEQYEQLITSYQNITLESLQQTANQLQQTFLNYYKKNKPYLYQQPQRMFDYFKKVSGYFFNYLSCLMMIVYKNNCKIEGREGFGIKNNVITSLKLIKVLEKVVAFFWELYWKFQDHFSLINNRNKLKQEKDIPTTIEKQYTPMLELIEQMNINFFKLLQKFCFPRSNEKFDFRHMRSCLIISSVLDIYKERLGKFVSSQGKFVEMRVRQSKQLIKTVLQIVQRASVSTASEQFQATNVQTKAKLTQNVIEKTTIIFTNTISCNHQQRTMPQLIYNQHFSLLVELMFENYSQLKQKIDQENFLFIGEENFVINIFKGIVRNASERVFESEEERERERTNSRNEDKEKEKDIAKAEQNNYKFIIKQLHIDESELQKLTVILQMYLAKQQYTIESEKLTTNICLVEQINQIPLLSMELFQQIVDFVINAQLVLPKSYVKVIQIIYESRYFDIGFLVKIKENVMGLRKFVDEWAEGNDKKDSNNKKNNENKQLKRAQQFTQYYHLQSYATLFIQLYQKLMTTYMMSFTSQKKNNKISPTYLLQIGFEIFQCILQLNQLMRCINRDELVMLWRMKRSLTNKIRMSERGYKDVRLDMLLLGNVLCVKDDNIGIKTSQNNSNNNNNSNNKNQIPQLISQTLQIIYQKLSLSTQKYHKYPKKSTQVILEMIQPFNSKESTFFKDLFMIMGKIDNNQLVESILFPSEFMQLLNDSLVNFSQGLRQYNKKTLGSLIGLDTPTFKMEEEKKKKDAIIKKKNKSISSSSCGLKKKTSIKSLQIDEYEQETLCQLERNMARSGNTQQSAVIQNKSNKKQVIISSLQFEDIEQGESQSNDKQQPPPSIERQQQTDGIRQSSEEGSLVVLQLPSSENSFQDVEKVNSQKLALIKEYMELYENLLKQLQQCLQDLGIDNNNNQSNVGRQSQEKDFDEVIQDMCAMVDKLQSGGIYKKQIEPETKEMGIKDQCLDMMKQCHLTVAVELRKLIFKYQQHNGQSNNCQGQKLKQLLIALEQSLTQIGINCPLRVIQSTIKQKKLKQKIIRLQRLSKQQFRKARDTIQKLTLNPRQSKGYFDEEENDMVEEQQQSDDKRQEMQKKQGQTCQQNIPTSTPFIEYIQLFEQLTQQMDRLSVQEIKQLFELKQSQLRQFLLNQYSNIIATPYHQQVGQIGQVLKLFQIIRIILTQTVWKSSQEDEQSQQQSIMLYEMIYQTVYPCLIEYIDLSKEIASIVKDILKHNLVVLKKSKKKNEQAKYIQGQSFRKVRVQEEERS